jgi:hypothetical protein
MRHQDCRTVETAHSGSRSDSVDQSGAAVRPFHDNAEGKCFLDDPGDMRPENRMAAVAAILAAGYLCLKSRLFTEKPLDCSGGPMPLCDQRLAEVAR